MITLYDCATAPSPRRARILLAEKGVAHDTVQVDLKTGEQMGDAYRQINPHCTVPALRTGDRELGPLRGLTGGGGIQIRLGPDSSPADFTLNLQGEAVWTTYFDDLYLTNRVSGLGVLAMEAVFE